MNSVDQAVEVRSPSNGVTAAAGFRAAGAAIGIKASGAHDLALLVADRPVPTVAVFTNSLAAAPPVQLGRLRLADGQLQAIVINSGIANAGTGDEGMRDAIAVGAALAEQLGCEQDDVLVCSTGVIGPRLPVEAIVAAMPSLASDLGDDAAHAETAARGIMTTDSVPKQATVNGGGWMLGGMAKGAGMIRPDMATMLAFLTTDAVLEASTMDPMLKEAVASTFNCLNVDGCQSTNDTVVLMASGASGVRPDPARFGEALESVCGDLAMQMAQDAEGASKVVKVDVTGAPDRQGARDIGMQVADSSLVRSAFHGADPNWGRVLAAVGVAGVPIDQRDVSISFAGFEVCRNGTGVPIDEDSVSQAMADDFVVTIRVGAGPGSARVITTDLTPDYVRFNSERS